MSDMEIALDLGKRYSYADFLCWLDDVGRELVDGIVKVMASARPPHQRVSGSIYRCLCDIVESGGGACAVYYELDVMFTEDGIRDPGSVKTVLCPDVIVVCDPSKIDNATGCWGAPDLVIEIQSPNTAHYDMHRKYEIYEHYGVREYWVVQPTEHWVLVFTLGESGVYGDGVLYERGAAVPVGIFGGALIEASAIFKQ
jgi:Uma2 family endonuclease